MTTAVLYTALSTALYILGSRAKITSWLWSRYPPWIEYWALCPACSGFWYGVLLAMVVGMPLEMPFLGLDPGAPYTPPIVGLWALVTTPILAHHSVLGWAQLAVVDDEREEILDTKDGIS